DGIDRRFDDFLQAEIGDTGKPVSWASQIDIPRGAANFRTFAELIALDRNSFAEMIARMTAKGYVRRMRSAEDGRAYALEIS
ncbi:MarR family transcriptional regulator, partial [Achromobacter xylosoxidans]|uniref:MarR family transcriptional regulator n=1 Tax=Alcaligenes xylosoxydans xylosoxydans TaxID=85698 RepID=UPI001F0CF850